MARPNWVYPLLKEDDSGAEPHDVSLEWEVEPGSPVLSPLSGELIEWDTRSWPDDPYHDQGIGELFSAKILTMVDGKRVINVVGPILYVYGSGLPQPNKGDAIYRGQVLGESADLPDRNNLSWTSYLNDDKGGRFMNPATLASKMGSTLEHYDNPGLLPELPKETILTTQQNPKSRKGSGAIGILLIVGAVFAARKWGK
jgi:hypothetical protein